MLVLLGFALLAGAGTALSPCVLPVLPALLSAGGVGGRRRPLGDRARALDHVHRHDRRPRQCRRRRRARQRPPARRGDRRAARLRRSAARARPERPSGGAALAAGALRPAKQRATASARACSSAARWASSTRRARARSSPRSSRSARHRGARSCSRSPMRPARRSCCSRSRSAGARLFERVRRAGRGPALQRALGVVMILTAVAILDQPRRELRPVRRRTDPRRQPHGGARVLGLGHRPPA